MINGLEGIPGSGKSYEGVVYHVLEALKQGRLVITNLPLNVDQFAAIDPAYRDLIELRTRPAKQLGVWDATDIAERPAFQLWADRDPADPPESVFTFGTVWDFYTTWRGPNGQGPLYVIDECHVSFPKTGTPDSVVQWFKLHRHFNADVLLMTQSFRDINQPIAQLIATLIKVRKADILGKADHYIRKVHAGYRGAVIQQGERKYKPQYFGLYRSNTQSSASAEASAEDVKPFIVYFNRFKWVWLIFCAVIMVWAFWPKPGRTVWGTKTPEARAAATVKGSPQAHVVPTPPSSNAPSNGPAKQASNQEQEPEPKEVPKTIDPLFGKLLHLTGYMRKADKEIYAFVVSGEGRQLFDLTSDELVNAGYTIKASSPCLAFVQYRDVIRPVTCDAPYQSGTVNKPIVIDSGSGGRSDRNDENRPRGQASAEAIGWEQRMQARNAEVRSVFESRHLSASF
ncbi:zonular occludens toxin domain-containing protein [Comamonas sp. JNW]|uniref:zonular occludens toxin domain-containing protein n=1 Tax=Comamonas sp. JNW TaxID=2170731 RepID=UPI000DE66F70|nr:zonular occludens toxin domain-containing protein [Comamonas sp. JNW]PWB18841.1 zonular occludens toxin [Comamonas sp. JNW]